MDMANGMMEQEQREFLLHSSSSSNSSAQQQRLVARFSVSTKIFESSFVLNVCEIVVARWNYPIILFQLLHLFHQIRTIEYRLLLPGDGLKIRFLRRLSCLIQP